jgi:hypothetical protein
MPDRPDWLDDQKEYLWHVCRVPKEVRKSISRFPENQKGTRVDNYVLLGDIISLAEELGHPPDSVEMDEKGPGKTQTYQERFGSYPVAMELAGFEPKFVSTQQRLRYQRERDRFDELLTES